MSQPQSESTSAAATVTVKPVVKRRRRANSVGEPSKRQRASKHQQQQQTGDTVDVGNALAPINAVHHSGGDAVVAVLQQEVASLRSLVQQQQLTITHLQSRFDELFVAFGISSSSSSAVPIAAASSSAVGDVASDSTAPQQSTAGRTYASTVRSVKEAVVAAVYVDQAATEQRTSSFIVSGLPTSSGDTDKTVVADLCSRELGIRPEITATKRLGQPTSTRKQPVLVFVKQHADAQSILHRAKSLRLSSDAYIKSNVFFNANLTRAQAKAAYELRCARRNRLSRMGADRRNDNVQESGSVDPVAQATGRVLDPAAPSFDPKFGHSGSAQ